MPSLAQQARWSPRARRWLTASAVLAGLGILAADVLPRWAELADLRGRQQSAARALADAQMELSSLRPAQQSATAGAPATASLSADPDGWIRRITDMSGADRLHGITVQAGVPQQSGPVWRLPLVLNFDGDYLDACTFLRDAERLPAVVRISTLHLHCTNLPTGQVEVQVAMTAYLPENP
jgi:Tfp pilus assembly protein PilO